MSDAWEEIQAIKTKRNSLREKVQKRKKERQDILNLLTGSETATSSPTVTRAAAPIRNEPETKAPDDLGVPAAETDPVPVCPNDYQVETQLLRLLTDAVLSLPVSAADLHNSLCHRLNSSPRLQTVVNLLNKFNAQLLISVSSQEGSNLEVVSVEHVKLAAMLNDMAEEGHPTSDEPPNASEVLPLPPAAPPEESDSDEPSAKLIKIVDKEEKNKDKKAPDIMSLLSMPSIREKETKKVGEEIVELLSKPTAKERSLVDRFKSNGTQVQEFCPHGTRADCSRVGSAQPCSKLHFNKIIQKHTDETLGDCSFLNTCFHMDTCKYVHYEVDSSGVGGSGGGKHSDAKDILSVDIIAPRLYPPQWIQCDLRFLDMSVLGKFAVIMADPPWDIHMELPYGTMSDDEMRQLGVPCLQDNGLIFLWVTGRAMELGRECLQLWGYERVDELIWVKTNQLQRIIRTGRTGHWLNHGKEHCLVGRKGDISGINRGLDCDVLVAEVRATSHKPDEIYGIIERLSPGTRKIELFGRPHNVQPNWITLGNQVEGVRIVDQELIKNFRKRYPDGNCMKPPDS